jgi:drug/metabolite transporter (DMT)-like permease
MTRRDWLLFTLLSALWGAPYLLIKIAVDDLSSPVIVCSRLLIGALVVAPFARRRGGLGALRNRLPALAGIAALEMAAPFVLITEGERHITSSLTGILVASAPLFVALLVLRNPDERATRARWAGLALGLVGVGVLLGLDVSGDSSALVGAALVLVAGFSYAVGALLLRAKFSDLPAETVMCCALAVAALMVAPAAIATLPSHAPPLGTVAAVGGLGVACTGAAFAIFGVLMLRIGPTRASVVAYVAPGFAVLFGVALLGEPLSAQSLAGLALILLGSWLATREDSSRAALAGRDRSLDRHSAPREDRRPLTEGGTR